MKTDILFIHPANHKKSYQQLANEFTAIAPPVWTLLLAGHCRNKGFSVKVHDTNLSGWSKDIANNLIAEHNPELIVVMVYGHNPSASTQTMPAAMHIIKQIKALSSDLPIAIGGLHPTALPEKTLNETMADYVLHGEAAIAICSLFRWLQGKMPDSKLTGISRRNQKKQIVHSAPCELITDLDAELGTYAWDLIPPLSTYRAHNSHTIQYFESSQKEDFSDCRTPYAVLYTSLGCPFQCDYCCINKLFGRARIRYWSINKVLEWIDDLVLNHQIKHIRLDDELFVLKPKRVEEFCDRLIERKYDLNLWAYSRVDTIQQQVLKKMKRAGFNWLCLGIETANSNIRSGVNKHIGNDVTSVVRAIQDQDIHVLGNFMFGLPDDTRQSMQATLNMAKNLNCEFVNFYCTMAYPGSRLYDQWISTDPNMLPSDWNGFSQHSYDCLPLPTRHLSAAQVLAFRDDAFNTYFTNEDYLLMLEQKFGLKARAHIERMTEVKLDRRLLADKKMCVNY